MNTPDITREKGIRWLITGIGSLVLAIAGYLFFTTIYVYNPLYWTVLIGCFILGILILPIWVYFLSPKIGRGLLGRSLWIISSLTYNGTALELCEDGQYEKRPLRVNNDGNTLQIYKNGKWQDLEGPKSYVTRLGFRPFAITWEKTDQALRELEVDPDRDGMPISTVKQALQQESVRADGSGHTQTTQDEEDVGGEVNLIVGSEYGGQPDQGLRGFKEFNPYPGLAKDSKESIIINTRHLVDWLKQSARTSLIQTATEQAIVDASHTTRLQKIATIGGVIFALILGILTAMITV